MNEDRPVLSPTEMFFSAVYILRR